MCLVTCNAMHHILMHCISVFYKLNTKIYAFTWLLPHIRAHNLSSLSGTEHPIHYWLELHPWRLDRGSLECLLMAVSQMGSRIHELRAAGVSSAVSSGISSGVCMDNGADIEKLHAESVCKLLASLRTLQSLHKNGVEALEDTNELCYAYHTPSVPPSVWSDYFVRVLIVMRFHRIILM